MTYIQQARTDVALEELLTQLGWHGLMSAVFALYEQKIEAVVPQVDPLGSERQALEAFIERQRGEVDGFLELLNACKLEPLPRELSLGRWRMRVVQGKNDDQATLYMGLLAAPDPAFETIPVGPRQYPDLKGATVGEIVAKAWEIVRSQEAEWQQLEFKAKDVSILEALWLHVGKTKAKASETMPVGGAVYANHLWSGGNDLTQTQRNRCNILTRMGFLQKRKHLNYAQWLFDPEFAQTYARPDLFRSVAEQLKLK